MLFEGALMLLLVAWWTLMLICGEGSSAETAAQRASIGIVSKHDMTKTPPGYLRFRRLTDKKDHEDSRSHETEDKRSKGSKGSKGGTSSERNSGSTDESLNHSQSTLTSQDESTPSDSASKSSKSSSSGSSSKEDSNDSKSDTKPSSTDDDSKSDTKPLSTDDMSTDGSDSNDSDSDDSRDKSSSTKTESSDSDATTKSDNSKESGTDSVEDSSGGDSDSSTGSDADSSGEARGCSIIPGELIDPCNQPVFKNLVPNAVDPAFLYQFDENNKITVEHCKSDSHVTGLVDENGNELTTTIYGYGAKGTGVCTWPGMTFETKIGEPVYVTWENNLPIEPYILTSRDGISVVDTSFHWAYSIEGYDSYSIEDNGVPVVPHLHGGHDDSEFDGNPEFFFTPNWEIKGPQWQEKEFVYDNSQPAATLWYHDHTLGLTRLNVYAGMVGFFLVRDDQDTGKPDNPLGLPVFPYEAAFAIQDRMFKVDGSLFYPAFPGDPYYEGFIVEEGAELPEDQFPNGGPTALAEFFGDVILVNGIAWPKMDVEPRNYRLRLLNGCDSRFLILRFFKVNMGETEVPTGTKPLEFVVIASDQSLATEPRTMDMLIIEPGSRYDIVFNFEGHEDSRIIMHNIGPDEPFSGGRDDYDLGDTGGNPEGKNPEEFEIGDDSSFETTKRVMAFDVVKSFDDSVADEFDASNIMFPIEQPDATRTRQLALFEGLDEFGRLQPLLGTVGPATDLNGDEIFFPTTQPYQYAGTAGLQMEGTLEWHEETTENPKLDSTEIWELWNMSGDAHPIHIHLVYFEVLGRREIKFDSCTTEEETVCDPSNAVGDGTYLLPMNTVESSGNLASGFKVMNPTAGSDIETHPEYFENARKDVVTALPGQITRLKMTFDKPGRYVWHCHILAHEDHEMMRVLYVGDPSQETG